MKRENLITPLQNVDGIWWLSCPLTHEAEKRNATGQHQLYKKAWKFKPPNCKDRRGYMSVEDTKKPFRRYCSIALDTRMQIIYYTPKISESCWYYYDTVLMQKQHIAKSKGPTSNQKDQLAITLQSDKHLTHYYFSDFFQHNEGKKKEQNKTLSTLDVIGYA